MSVVVSRSAYDTCAYRVDVVVSVLIVQLCRMNHVSKFVL